MSARLVMALALLAASTSSHALYANVTPPSGFSFAGGVLKYGGTPAAALNWVSGASGISTSTSFIGRNFIVPGTARLAPGAGQAVARAMLTNPAFRVAPMLTWAAAALWAWDEVNQRFTKSVPGLWNTTFGSFSGGTAEAACRQVYEGFYGTGSFTHVQYFGDDFGLCYGAAGQYGGAQRQSSGSSTVVTEADADALAEAHPMPDAVANEAQKLMPLPVALPELQPLVQPIGQPRETPEGTVQDRVRITPANDDEAPWRVEETVETVPEGTDPETEGEDKPVDPCDAHPERVGCQTLEAPDDPGIPSETRTITYTPDNLGFGSGCPAPRNFMFHGWALPLDYTPLCNVAPTIRLGLIAITALGCILIIIGVTRS
ncbi:virulence factor TspB C-terminal domain-related protein [Methylibium petroleiphilum]|uniref:virulence factor TspB C-terminal domain-related protein n=1 Tax=Methylibium petroleiphilum TaxID=105560 RepID=UPI001AC121C6|nr:virulence factor TspB C-terminal domain-related protein [Methylibium petroleiphilum]MBN9203851.1 hypothetical protein [Methylibium petroleiphilum]